MKKFISIVILSFFVTLTNVYSQTDSIKKINLTEIEINNAVATIRKYDFFLLSVDSSKNVFINPFIANQPPYFLRLEEETGDSTIKKGYVYKLYRDNWYITK